MTSAALTPPAEPLRDFSGLASALRSRFEETDVVAARYREAVAAGRILPNTIEALRIELTYHSNAIEGSTLTLRETQLVIEGKTPAGEKPLREIYEARNHHRALELIERWARQRPDAPLDERDLLDVHALVLADIAADAAGRFRSDRVRIVGTNFIPPGSHRFGDLLPALLTLARRPDVHPVLRAAELHYNLVAVHPFNDGNGRTARLAMQHHLLRLGYPYAIVEVADRGSYLAAVDHANAGRLELFARFIAECLIRSAEKLLLD